jgi:hypothetical protein
VTGGGVAAAALQTKAIAIVNVARVIAASFVSVCRCRVEGKRGTIRRMMRWKATLAILVALFASIALADDFKTVDGKEYKNAKVSRVEPDGLVLMTKSGISKVYFSELPKEVQERFGYDPQKAAEFTAQSVEQNKLFLQQRVADAQKGAEERAKYWRENPTPVPVEREHGSALDRDAGPKPQQLPDGTVPSLDRQIRALLLDPDSLIYVYWGDLKLGQSPGGNPAWTVTVTYRAKNSYGAYPGNKTEIYWLKGKWWLPK